MVKCEICGKEIGKGNYVGGYVLCSKHMHQWLNYGKFLDNNPRTVKDLNEYIIEGDITRGGLYNGITSEQIGEFLIDTEDLPKVRYHKWRITHNHVVTGLPAQGTQRDLSWVVLDLDNRVLTDIVVDHINGNPFDNRKQNLRICTQAENVRNKSFMSNNTSGFIGVSYKKDRNTYDPEIRLNKVRCHLGTTKTIEEAVYKRYYAEQLLFKEFANADEQRRKKEFTDSLPEETKANLRKIVEEKLRAKNLWQ
jgi:hypothetical protein